MLAENLVTTKSSEIPKDKNKIIVIINNTVIPMQSVVFDTLHRTLWISKIFS